MYVRQMFPLESGTITDTIDSNYYLEGNSFIEYSDFKSESIRFINQMKKKAYRNKYKKTKC